MYKGSTEQKGVIVLNNKVGIRAPEHTIEGANFVSEWDVSTNHDVDVGRLRDLVNEICVARIHF